jgi:hypothetical protein
MEVLVKVCTYIREEPMKISVFVPTPKRKQKNRHFCHSEGRASRGNLSFTGPRPKRDS